MTAPIDVVAPLIPARWSWVALFLGTGLGAASAHLPGPWPAVAAVLSAVCLFFGGYGFKPPAWVAGKPLLTTTLAPVAVGAYHLVQQFLPHAPPTVQAWGPAVVGVLALLGGLVLPQPTVSPGAAPPSAPAARSSTGAAAALLLTMSLGAPAEARAQEQVLARRCTAVDVARGLCRAPPSLRPLPPPAPPAVPPAPAPEPKLPPAPTPPPTRLPKAG
jgi:hypothetical protein